MLWPVHIATLLLCGPPPQVVEAEKNATPNRKLRLAATAALATAATASAAISTAHLAHFQPADSIQASILPVDNEILSLTAAIVILASCNYVWVQEQKNREENVQRIWEEVKKRKMKQAKSEKSNVRSKRPNKTQAQARRERSSKSRAENRARAEDRAQAEAVEWRDVPSPTVEKSTVSPALSDFFAEANALARAQAMQLNSALEDQGVLPRISEEGPAGSGVDSTCETGPVSVESDSSRE